MKTSSIVIVDYGMGNIRSIVNKITRAGFKVTTSYEIEIIKDADKLILPGVGHFLNGMKKLNERNLINILTQKVLIEKTPILGICLGMQLFTAYSEEGNTAGLGWIDGETVKFQLNDIRHKVPHMGWNSIELKKKSPLMFGIPENSYFYFVHSYYVSCNTKNDILSMTNYGHDFVSAVQKNNIYGTQFHPEKSHEWGEKILNNFLRL